MKEEGGRKEDISSPYRYFLGVISTTSSITASICRGPRNSVYNLEIIYSASTGSSISGLVLEFGFW